MPFDAFISYSHAADGELAPAVQNGLQRLAKPWTSRQALRVFRDDTGLSVSPGLWPSITAALDESQFFILMASPGAAESEWVGREIEYWLASRPDAAQRILPVLTDGAFVWNEDDGDIDWGASTAAPAALAGVFASEPRHLDLVWARTQEDLDLHNARFRDAIADLAAPIHGISKDELESEDVRQHRKALMLRRSAVAGLVVLLIGLGIASVLALRSADTARAALSDLEDANGNISDLEAEEARLTAANAAAEVTLADTEESLAEAETAKAEAEQQATEAERAATEAEQQASEAETARIAAEDLKVEAEREASQAEIAREAAVEAQRVAEEAEAAAESARQEAEQARIDAQVARAAAQMERDAARSDAAEAQRLADEAERQAAAARQAEAEAQAATRVANEAALAAQEAEAAAREEQTQAEAAAGAAERAAATAREAEADAKVAQQTAEDLQAQAEDAARIAASLQRIAEDAARAASLAQASLEASNPALSALLAVESFCAADGCGATTGLAQRSTEASESAASAELTPVLRMLEVAGEQQDFAGDLPGWTGVAVETAVSADGEVVAALASDGRLRLWHPSVPDGVAFDLADVEAEIGSAACTGCQQITGLGLSSDGSTLAYSTRPSRPDDILVVGDEWLYFVDVESGSPLRRARFGCRPRIAQADHVEIEFHPVRDQVALLVTEPAISNTGLPVSESAVIVHDPRLGGSQLRPSGRPCPPFPDAIPITDAATAVWASDGRLVTFSPGSASTVDLDRSSVGIPLPMLARTEFDTQWTSSPTASAVAGDVFAVAGDDGVVALFEDPPGSGGTWAPARHRISVADVTHLVLASDARTIIAATSTGLVRRIPFGPRSSATTISESSIAPVDVEAAVQANVAVIAENGRVVRRTIGTSWQGASVATGRASTPSANGVITTSDGDTVLQRPDGTTIALADALNVELAVDGSAVLVRPRAPSRAYVLRGDDLRTIVPLDRDVSGPMAAISPSGVSVAIFTGSDEVEVFDARSGRRIGGRVIPSLCGNRQTVDRLMVSDRFTVVQVSSRCGVDQTTVLLTADHDGVTRGDPVDVFDNNEPLVRLPMSISDGPDGMLVFNEPRLDAVVRGIHLATGQLNTLFDAGFGDDISALSVEPLRAEMTAVAYSSGRVIVWDNVASTPLVEVSRHDREVGRVALGRAEGQLRLATSADGTAVTRVLDDPVALRTSLCTIASRSLSAAEWTTYVGPGDPLPCRRGL